MVELSDERLLELIRVALAEADPVPPELFEAARQAFTWRTIDTELAEILRDSVELTSTPARPGRGPRLVTFTVDDLEVELQIAEDGPRRRLLGQLAPPQSGDIEIRQSSGVAMVEADGMGRFEAVNLSAGPVSLLCRLPARRKPVVTEWLSI